jgi:hypothetical protein
VSLWLDAAGALVVRAPNSLLDGGCKREPLKDVVRHRVSAWAPTEMAPVASKEVSYGFGSAYQAGRRLFEPQSSFGARFALIGAGNAQFRAEYRRPRFAGSATQPAAC